MPSFRRWILGLSIFLLVRGTVWGEGLPVPAAGEQARSVPLEVYFTTLSGLRYLENGELLTDKELGERILAQGDGEAVRMLRVSERSSALAPWASGIGSAAVLVGGIAFMDDPKDRDNVLVGLGVALGGFALSLTGALLNSEAKSAKFNAAQRYDRVIGEKGGTAPPPGAGQVELPPIDVRLSTLQGFQYSARGKVLARPRDLQGLISPLNDFESERLLKRSTAAGSLSALLTGIGLGGETAVLAVNAGAPAGGDRIGFWLPLAGCLIALEAGTFLGMESETAKFNAVKRYNRFSAGQEQVLPQGPGDDTSLLDFGRPAAPAQGR